MPFEVISGHMRKEMSVNGSLTNLIYFHDNITRSIDVRRSADVPYFDFGRTDFTHHPYSHFLRAEKTVQMIRLNDSDLLFIFFLKNSHNWRLSASVRDLSN